MFVIPTATSTNNFSSYVATLAAFISGTTRCHCGLCIALGMDVNIDAGTIVFDLPIFDSLLTVSTVKRPFKGIDTIITHEFIEEWL